MLTEACFSERIISYHDLFKSSVFSLQKCVCFNLILDSWPIGTRKENVIVYDAVRNQM